MTDRPSYEELEKRLKELEQKNLLINETAREMEERYKALFERSFDIIYVHDFEGRFLDASKAVSTTLGYSRDELGTLTFESLLREDQIPLALTTIRELRETGFQRKANEYWVRRKDGGFVWLETKASVIYRSGEPYAIQGIARDITDWKKAQEQLSKSSERYRTIFENTGNASILIGEDTTILLVNSNFEKLTGFSKQEMEGKMNWTAFIVPEDLEMMRKYHVQRRDNPDEAPGSYEFRLKIRSGDLRDIYLTVAMIPGTSESVASCMDITDRKRSEEPLRLSEEKYRSILENMEESYFEVDLAGNFTFFNEAASRMSGYSPQELLGMNYRRYSPPETAKRMFEVFNNVYQTGKAWQMVDYQVIHKDGSLHDNELSVGLMKDASGKPVGFHSLVRDVTERKRSEKALRESEERYRGILENMEEAYYEVDLNGNFTFFNPRPAQRLGYEYDELMGINFRQYMDEENAKKVFNAYHHVFMTGETLADVAWELNTKGGQKMYVEASVSLRRDSGGNPAGFRGVVRDITERRHAEDALRMSEEKYRTILESMEDAYFESDLKGNLTLCNDSLCNTLGYSRQELMGMNFRIYSTPETSEQALRISREVFGTGLTKNMVNYDVIRKDGARRTLEISVSLIRSPSGEPANFRGIGRDITERIQAEQALRESEKRYRLLAENLQDVIWVLDADLKYNYVSPSVMRLRGYTPEEAMKQTMEQVLTPESYKKAVDIFAKELIREEKGLVHGKEWAINLELEMVRKDGSTVWTEVTINILYDDNGNPYGLLGVTRDISDRKKAEEVLHESEERWQFALEGAGDGIWDFDIMSRRVYRSKRWKEMLGYDEDEISDSPDEWTRLVHPDDRLRSDENLELHLQGVTPVYRSEHRIKCKDGSYKWILERGKIIRWSDDGHPLRIIGTQADITDRKQAEEAIREREEFYRTIFENTGNASMLLGGDTTVLLVNSNFEKLSGYSHQEVEGEDELDVVCIP